MAKKKTTALLNRWREAQKNLAIAKAEERELRSLVISEFADPDQDEGTARVTTSIGVLAVTKRLKYSLENKRGETKDLADRLPTDVAESLLNWSPSLDLAEYRKLKELANAEKKNGKYSKIIKQLDDVLTITNGSAQVKLK